MRNPNPESGVRCTARRKRTLQPCRAWCPPGSKVCRVHGFGGGRPARHGKSSAASAHLLSAYRRYVAELALALDRIGHQPSADDQDLILLLFGESAQCRATSRRTGERCRRRTSRTSSVCYFHGAGGGRPRADGKLPFERILGLSQSLEAELARHTKERIQRMLCGEELCPPPTDSERETVEILHSAARL